MGNRAADRAAKKAAFSELTELVLMPESLVVGTPSYSVAEEQCLRQQQGEKNSSRWYILPTGTTGLPEALAWQMVKQPHESTQLGAKKLTALMPKAFWHKDLSRLCRDEVSRCLTCQQVDVRATRVQYAKKRSADCPGRYWEIDFKELKPLQFGYKYLLVFIDIYSGWVETSPLKEKAQRPWLNVS